MMIHSLINIALKRRMMTLFFPFLIFVLLFWMLFPSVLMAQSSRILTIEDAEELLLSKNLELVAERLEAEAMKGGITKARAFYNPNLSVGQFVYSPNYNERPDNIFGNTDVELSKRFDIFGKRGEQIRQAKLNVALKNLSNEQLVWELKLRLKRAFYPLYFFKKSLSFYDKSIASLKETVKNADQLSKKTDILLSDVLSLKALFLALQSERLSLQQELLVQSNILSLLLLDESNVHVTWVPSVDEGRVDKIQIDFDEKELMELALAYRLDLQSADSQVALEKSRLKLEEQMILPDLTLGIQFVQTGNFVNNYFGAMFEFELPVLYWNQGDILMARKKLEASSKRKSMALLLAEREVREAYMNATQIEKLYRSVDCSFVQSHESLVDQMTQSYLRGELSLSGYVNFYSSFRESIRLVSELASKRLIAFEELNHAVNTSRIQF